MSLPRKCAGPFEVKAIREIFDSALWNAMAAVETSIHNGINQLLLVQSNCSSQTYFVELCDMFWQQQIVPWGQERCQIYSTSTNRNKIKVAVKHLHLEQQNWPEDSKHGKEKTFLKYSYLISLGYYSMQVGKV